MTFQLGEVVRDRYRIVQVLANGGMGIVYRATDESLGIDVAIKESLSGMISAERFKKNATQIAGLHHAGIPRITDTFELENGIQVLVMDFIPGDDLLSRIQKSGPLKVKEAIKIISTIGGALSYLHTQNPPIIHQDVKPGNIRITPDGKAMLIDFDLALTIQENQTRPPLSELGLTPGFAAPEQYNNMSEPASDQYGLAATLYFLLTGSVLPDGLTRASGNSQLPEHSASRLPLDVSTCLERALRINPGDRYPDMQSFLTALSALAKNHSELTAITTRRLKNGGWKKPSRYIPFIVIAGLLIVGIVAVILFTTGNAPGSEAEPISTLSSLAPAASSADPAGIPATEEIVATKPASTPTTVKEILPTPLGGGTGEYAYVSENTGIPQIYLASTASNKSTQLTNVPDGACQPNWSPDGMKIVFISPCPTKAQISARTEPFAGSGLFILSIADNRIIPLPSQPGGDFDPAWSPDGDSIAFTTIRNVFAQVFLYDLNTDETLPLTPPTVANRQPAWSPDGNQLAYCSNKNGSLQVWIMGREGNDPKPFSVQINGAAFNPDWSSDGKSLVYSQTNSLRLVMKKVNQPSLGESVLNARLSYASNPDISPDGYWVLFDSNMDGDNQVYRITHEGTGVEPLTPKGEKSYQPAWKPAQ